MKLRSEYSKTETETDKMGLKPIDIGHSICLGQYEHSTQSHTTNFYRSRPLSVWTHPKGVFTVPDTETETDKNTLWITV